MAKHQTLHQAIEDIAARHPERLAAVDERRCLTYHELMERSASLAAHLHALGVTGRLVGICVDRSVDTVVAVLGVLRAGAAYLPLDPHSPVERLGIILSDANPAALVVSSDTAHLTASDLPTIDIGAEFVSTHAPATATQPDELAYVIFTSGSTGRPKGVMVEHRHVLALFAAADRIFDFDEFDVWTMFHSHAFDFSVWEMFGALLHGACIVVISHKTIFDPEALWALIEREGVTVLSQTPSYFFRLVDCKDWRANGLRYVIFGGEELSYGRLRSWFDKYGLGGPALVNMYGITEITVHATYRKISLHDVNTNTSLIGHCLPHLTIELVDEQLRPVSPGNVGEILVSGASVARGYLARSDLTAERFLPARHEAGDVQYRSGDLARMNTDGELEYVGRIDDQVQVNGYRIEVREVQHHLMLHPGVADAVVTTRPGPDSAPRLIAYVLPDKHADCREISDIDEFLVERLPRYMLPQRVITVQDIPLTGNGKPNVDALPDPWSSAAECVPEIDSLDALVQQVISLWRQVLGAQSIGPQEKFFHAGGDSIHAISVASRAQTAGLPISVDDLLLNPTPGELAAILRQRGSSGPSPAHTPVRAFSLLSADDRELLPAGVEDAYPLTTLQVGMLIAGARSARQQATSADYHSVSITVINSELNMDRLRMAIDLVVSRNPALRTSFHLTGYSQPIQIVHHKAEAALRNTDISELTTVDQRRAIDSAIASEQSSPFAFFPAPLIRFRALHLNSEEFALLWSEHHAVLDGWSSALLLEQLVKAYLGEALPDQALVPFVEYVAMEVSASESVEHHTFWRTELQGIKPSRGLPSLTSGREFRAALPQGLWDRLQSVAGDSGLTPRRLIEASIIVAIGTVQRETEVVVGMVMHGRPDLPGADQSMGLFLNVVPHRTRISGTWYDITTQLEATARRVLPHRRYPMAAIQNDTGVRIPVALNFTDFHQIRGLVRRGVVSASGVQNTTINDLPLMIEASRRAHDGELSITLQARGSGWDESKAQQLADLLPLLLVRCACNPNSSVAATDAQPARPLGKLV